MKSTLLKAIPLLLAGVAMSCSRPTAPQPPSTFGSPAQAGAALFEALQKDDQPALLAMFGPDSTDVIFSGDAAEDHDSHQRFIESYRKMHRVGLDSENRTALIVGSNNWPFPIPLVNTDGKWRFDTAVGKDEVLYRRVGRNERGAIQTCRELVAAQKEYFRHRHDDQPAQQYAQHLVSAEGKHDGLFWQAENGQEESPIGPLLAFADAEAISKEAHAGRTPFHGYYFRMLKSGAGRSYIQNGRMTGGFAFLAYPAEYRSSGVMTFMVGLDGRVYQKDFGADSKAEADAMTAYQIDPSWAPAED